jgi:hypothetical protein
MNIDLERIAKLLGIVGSSVHEGEAVNAIRLVDREIKKAGLGWVDLINPSRELAAADGADASRALAIADEANAALLAENLALREALDSIRSREGGGQWADVASGGGNVNAVAQWALDLHRSHALALTEREIDLLNRCRRWRGRLTPRMSDWFEDLVAKVSARSEQYPPA